MKTVEEIMAILVERIEHCNDIRDAALVLHMSAAYDSASREFCVLTALYRRITGVEYQSPRLTMAD